LDSHGIEYTTMDLEDEDVRMNLLLDSVTLVEAPIVKLNDKYMDAESTLKELELW